MVDRDMVLGALRGALEPLGYVQAMWEGGAAAWGRVDEWSDIDLQMAVDDERAADAFDVVEQTLERLGGIDLAYRIPEPAWHGHSQRFYRLKDASPFLLIDLVVIRAGASDRFLEREIHGNPVVHFDKADVTSVAPIDMAALEQNLAERLKRLRTSFDMFQILTRKEINRGNAIEAINYYHGHTLRPLVEALRIRHTPAHHSFHTRYVHYELPPEIVGRLEPLFYPQNLDDLSNKLEQAGAWFGEIAEPE